MTNLKKTVEKILKEEKTSKKDLIITNEGVQRCPRCHGEGYYTGTNGTRVKCAHCDGAGFTYNKPVKSNVGKNVVALSDVKKYKKATQPKKAQTTPVKKVVTPVKEATPLNLKDMKFKTFTYDGIKYLLNNTLLVKENLVNTDQEFTEVEECVNKLLQVYFKALKVDTLKAILEAKGGVLGVRYAVRKDLPLVNLSGKVLDKTDYVQSALKLSKEVWIDIRYSEIFKNHRFVYLNPIKGKMIPVLCINKNTHKLDGIIMPLALN